MDSWSSDSHSFHSSDVSRQKQYWHPELKKWWKKLHALLFLNWSWYLIDEFAIKNVWSDPTIEWPNGRPNTHLSPVTVNNAVWKDFAMICITKQIPIVVVCRADGRKLIIKRCTDDPVQICNKVCIACCNSWSEKMHNKLQSFQILLPLVW